MTFEEQAREWENSYRILERINAQQRLEIEKLRRALKPFADLPIEGHGFDAAVAIQRAREALQ